MSATGDNKDQAYLTDPEALANLQQNMLIKTFIQQNYRRLPEKIKKRVHALKNIQLEIVKKEVEYNEELIKLDKKYAEIYDSLLSKRIEIIDGTYEPTENESNWDKSDDEDDKNDSLDKNFEEKLSIMPPIDENEPGIPEFWLTVFRSVSEVAELIEQSDEPILKYMSDLKVKYITEGKLGFVLEFYFKQNPYFTNAVLTKEYTYSNSLPEEFPLSYDGPNLIKCQGCTINWQPGMNVTQKTVKKTQKNKNRGDKRQITKTVKTDSFFNFFDPAIRSVDDEDTESDDEDDLEKDFSLGELLKDHIASRAVLFYTGECLDDEYDEDEDEDDDNFSDEEEDEEEEISPVKHRKNRAIGVKGGHKQTSGQNGSANGKDANCPQQ